MNVVKNYPGVWSYKFMKPVEIKPGIYWVGAKDWNVRDFHGYKTQRGTSYNAYLVVDEKITLIDTVKETHKDEMMSRIKSIVDPAKIDIIICNHVELDHAGSLPDVLKVAKNAQVIASTKGVSGLKLHFDTSDWNLTAIESGGTVSLGKRSLNFIHTPMLHWPDSMVSYMPEEKLLLPNDAFGQHIAIDSLFDDECPKDIIFEEAAKYYANIVYPYGKRVTGVIEALKGLEFDMVAPSHGVIWRKDINEIIACYDKWAKGESKDKALIVYDSMWGATEKMAEAVKAGFEQADIPVTIRCLKTAHISDVITDVLESKYIAIGSPTLNNNVLPNVAAFLTYMKGLKPINKVGFTFGSYGWFKNTLKDVEAVMQELKWEMPCDKVSINYRPHDNDLKGISEKISALVKG